MKEDQKQNPSLASDRSWSALGFAWELGYSIAIPLAVFTLGGRLLDRKLGTSPWLLLTGLFLSIFITFFIVYKKLMSVINESNQDEKNITEKNIDK